MTGFTSSPLSSTDGNYILSWDPVPGASSYVLAEFEDFGGNPVFSAPTTNLRTFTNRDSGTYLYSIKACDIWNACSSASVPLGSHLSVSVTRAAAPGTPTNLTAPTTRVTVPPNYTVGWNVVPGATRYIVEENPTCQSGPNNQVIKLVQEVTQNTFPGPLTACRIGGNQGFRYRVKACSGALCSAWSSFKDVDVYITGVQRSQAGPLVAKRTYLHTDALGSPIAETNTANPPQVIKRRYYEPYGASPSEDYPNGPGFTGHVTDQNTRLTYMQQRYYDPIAARFLSMDPVTTSQENGGNFNRYWYANNNPYKFTDPDGRQVRPFNISSNQSAIAQGANARSQGGAQALSAAGSAVGHAMPKAGFVQGGLHAQGGNGLMGAGTQGSIGVTFGESSSGVGPIPEAAFVSGGAMGQLGGASVSAPAAAPGTSQFVLGLSTGLDASIGLTNDPAALSSGTSTGQVISVNTPLGSAQGSYSSESGVWSASIGLPSAGVSVSKQEVSTIKREF